MEKKLKPVSLHQCSSRVLQLLICILKGSWPPKTVLVPITKLCHKVLSGTHKGSHKGTTKEPLINISS